MGHRSAVHLWHFSRRASVRYGAWDVSFASRMRQIERTPGRVLRPRSGPTVSSGCCSAPSQRMRDNGGEAGKRRWRRVTGEVEGTRRERRRRRTGRRRVGPHRVRRRWGRGVAPGWRSGPLIRRPWSHLRPPSTGPPLICHSGAPCRRGRSIRLRRGRSECICEFRRGRSTHGRERRSRIRPPRLAFLAAPDPADRAAALMVSRLRRRSWYRATPPPPLGQRRRRGRRAAAVGSTSRPTVACRTEQERGGAAPRIVDSLAQEADAGRFAAGRPRSPDPGTGVKSTVVDSSVSGGEKEREWEGGETGGGKKRKMWVP
jgi:hypothetical protein